jgi:Trk-type K+ transport system membrane component
MPLGYKWLVVFAMIVGRIEIVSIFAAVRSLPLLQTIRRFGGFLRKTIKR